MLPRNISLGVWGKSPLYSQLLSVVVETFALLAGSWRIHLHFEV